MKKGITVAGSIVVDKLKRIPLYPKKGLLVNISEVEQSMGGIVPNTGISLAKFSPELRVYARGLLGDDQDGSFALDFMKKNGLDVSGVKIKSGGTTSFTDVMSENGGERTFFHFEGTNAQYGIDDLLQGDDDSEIYHIGYLLMMQLLDEKDDEYGTRLARALKLLKERGKKTSIDVVSNAAADYKGIVGAALPHTDYFIVNEIEAGETVGIPARDEKGQIIPENIREILKKLMELGVRELACIHLPEGAFAMDSKRDFFYRKSLNLPDGYIKGSVGAGDAFCAGMLYGIWRGWETESSMDFGSAAAACCLSELSATAGMRAEAEVWEVYRKYSV